MKKTFAVIFSLLLLTTAFVGCGRNSNKKPIQTEIELSQADFSGLKYYEVYSQLESDGFTNIITNPLNDLTSVEEARDDTVDSVTINGSSTYQPGDLYSPSVEVIVSYHNIKMVYVPFSSNERPEDELYENVFAQFADAGFENVKCEPIEDLILGWLTKDGEIETILIAGEETFESLDLVAFDTEVIIRYHTFPSDDEQENGQTTDNPDVTETPKITVSMGEDEFLGMHYTEAEQLLREMGFTVFEYVITETEDPNEPDDTVADVDIKAWAFGKGGFEIGDTYGADAIVVLRYYNCDEPEPNLTAESCPDLAALLQLKDPNDSSIFEFSNKYYGKVIEFDGCVWAITNHGDYNTRFDILIGAGDFDPNTGYGPNFRFTDVNTTDMDLHSLFLEDVLSVGDNVHVIAEVGFCNGDTMLFELDPISVRVR